MGKPHALRRIIIEFRRRAPFVAVAAKVVCAQSVYDNQNDMRRHTAIVQGAARKNPSDSQQQQTRQHPSVSESFLHCVDKSPSYGNRRQTVDHGEEDDNPNQEGRQWLRREDGLSKAFAR